MKSFSELSPREVLSLAIAIEERNRDRYSAWSKRFSTYDTEAVSLLEELAKEEEEHRRYLIRRYFEAFGESVLRMDPADFNTGLELGELPDEHFFVVNSAMARSILEMALRHEEAAARFYADALAAETDPRLRAVYEPLVHFEDDHARLLADRLSTF